MEQKKNSKRFEKSYFDVVGLCCSSEVPVIENILKPLDGVKEVTVIIATRTVIVVHDTNLISQSQIAKALTEGTFKANVRVYGEEILKKKWPNPYSIVCGVLLLLSFLKYVYRPLGWFALAAVAIGIFPICLKAIAAIRNLRLDINILAIVAVIGTIAMGDYLEAGTIVFLFTVAEWLESRASHKANAAMSSLMNMVPQKAVIAETGEVVNADEVKLNTIIAVKAGELIAIDGVVVEGNCEVDEKTLTGESFPVNKQKDSTVWAGTINVNGYITVRTTALAEDCAVAKMAKVVEEAQNSKSQTQRFIDKCAKFYTPAVLIIAISVAVVPAALRLDNLKRWFHLALVILVSACPCGLILSTPVATFCALTKAAKSGLLIKGGDYLEILSKIKTVAFDKTGTITQGEFIVTDFESLRDDLSVEALLYWVSSIESKSSHPMAAALVAYGKSLSIDPKPENVEDFQNFPGEGICGRIDGKHVYIGNKKISTRASCETIPTLEGSGKGGKSVGYIYSEGMPAGIFTLSDACRSGVADAIKELKSLGIKSVMLTGDSRAAALYTNEQVGNAIEVVHAELLPEDKVKFIKQYKAAGRTCMVGDGINDAPALATADIGIAMGISGSALASETGNVILLSNDMKKIPKAIKLAKRAHIKVIQNIVLSIGSKMAIIALAIAGHPLVWAAVLADVGTCLLVIFNSMLLLTQSHRHSHAGKCHKSYSFSSHSHKHECNNGHGVLLLGKEARHGCETQKCSSETTIPRCQAENLSSASSCCETKCEKPDEARHYHHRTCESVDHDPESRNSHSHANQDSKNCINSNSPVTESPKTVGSSTGPSTCCGKNHVKTKSPQKTLEPGCEHQHREHLSCSKEQTVIDVSQDQVNHVVSDAIVPLSVPIFKSEGCCGGHGKEFPAPVARAGCPGFEKIEFGGCCKSYMKECCSTKHMHLGAALEGGLSEVVIEH